MLRENDPTTETSSKSGPGFFPELRAVFMTRLRPAATHLFADMAACVRFFSRLPLPPVNVLDDPAAPPDFIRIARAAPLAGAVIALPAAGLGLILGLTALPPMAMALLIAAALTLVTGALHEDGLADVADGFFGGATRERRLEIMKDSRIGAFGALALVFSILLRTAFFAALLDRFSVADTVLLVVTGESVSRFLMIWQWQRLPLARPDGLAARFGKPSHQSLRQALALTTALLLPALLANPIGGIVAGCLLAAIFAQVCGRLAVAKIGGTTGDVLGMVQQISGLGFLAGMLMLP